jgi:hypothetical protein
MIEFIRIFPLVLLVAMIAMASQRFTVRLWFSSIVILLGAALTLGLMYAFGRRAAAGLGFPEQVWNEMWPALGGVLEEIIRGLWAAAWIRRGIIISPVSRFALALAACYFIFELWPWVWVYSLPANSLEEWPFPFSEGPEPWFASGNALSVVEHASFILLFASKALFHWVFITASVTAALRSRFVSLVILASGHGLLNWTIGLGGFDPLDRGSAFTSLLMSFWVIVAAGVCFAMLSFWNSRSSANGARHHR